jgi:hypothetical protein
MKYSKYPMKVGQTHTKYEFTSDGPRGKILKAVIYGQIEEDLFNLAFGDWNTKLQKIDDTNRSNNGDRDKVLATVAATAIDFTDKFPGAIIYTEGSTPSRTRLYQIEIAKNLEEVSESFEIEGYINGSWEPFQRGRNYEAFLVRRK